MSRAASLFDLAGEVTQKHERSPLGQITVIPVLVDDLKIAMPVLRALCDVNEGRLFSSSDPELQSPVPSTIDGLRRPAVTAALVGRPASGAPARRVVLVDKTGGLVDAEFTDSPTGPTPSPGEQEVLSVARATVHRELDDHKFAVITYRESLIDITFQPAIWALAVDQLNAMPHRTLRTLVFVAEDPIDIDMHCQTGRGFQFALDDERLLMRKGADNLRMAAAHIARHADPVVLFLGGGFSASSHLPLGNRLRDAAIRRLLGISETDPVTSAELGHRFHELAAERHWLSAAERGMSQQKFIAQLTVEQVIRAEQRMDPSLPTLQQFRDHHNRVIGAPGSAVLDLARVLRQRVGRIVIAEVNFDLLVETHAGIPVRVFASQDDFRRAPEYLERYLAGRETEVPVLKLHGSISDLDTCVVSTEQTELGIGAEKLAALNALLSIKPPRLWIYVGTSLRDLDLRPLLLGEEFARGVDELWVSPYLDESTETFGRSREPRWRRETNFPTIQDRLITETADAFFAELSAAVDAN